MDSRRHASIHLPALIMLYKERPDTQASSSPLNTSDTLVTSRPELRAAALRPMPLTPAARRTNEGWLPARCAGSIGTSGTLAARGASTICRGTQHVRGRNKGVRSAIGSGSGSHAGTGLPAQKASRINDASGGAAHLCAVQRERHGGSTLGGFVHHGC